MSAGKPDRKKIAAITSNVRFFPADSGILEIGVQAYGILLKRTDSMYLPMSSSVT
jgi:hypothetical protein